MRAQSPVVSPAGRTETPDPLRPNALDPGFHDVPAGPARTGRAARHDLLRHALAAEAGAGAGGGDHSAHDGQDDEDAPEDNRHVAEDQAAGRQPVAALPGL